MADRFAMQLALITGEFPPQQGGVGDYTRALASEFARRGLAVTVITDQHALGLQPTAANDYALRITHYVMVCNRS